MSTRYLLYFTFDMDVELFISLNTAFLPKVHYKSYDIKKKLKKNWNNCTIKEICIYILVD